MQQQLNKNTQMHTLANNLIFQSW